MTHWPTFHFVSLALEFGIIPGTAGTGAETNEIHRSYWLVGRKGEARKERKRITLAL